MKNEKSLCRFKSSCIVLFLLFYFILFLSAECFFFFSICNKVILPVNEFFRKLYCGYRTSFRKTLNICHFNKNHFNFFIRDSKELSFSCKNKKKTQGKKLKKIYVKTLFVFYEECVNYVIQKYLIK